MLLTVWIILNEINYENAGLQFSSSPKRFFKSVTVILRNPEIKLAMCHM